MFKAKQFLFIILFAIPTLVLISCYEPNEDFIGTYEATYTSYQYSEDLPACNVAFGPLNTIKISEDTPGEGGIYRLSIAGTLTLQKALIYALAEAEEGYPGFFGSDGIAGSFNSEEPHYYYLETSNSKTEFFTDIDGEFKLGENNRIELTGGFTQEQIKTKKSNNTVVSHCKSYVDIGLATHTD